MLSYNIFLNTRSSTCISMCILLRTYIKCYTFFQTAPENKDNSQSPHRKYIVFHSQLLSRSALCFGCGKPAKISFKEELWTLDSSKLQQLWSVADDTCHNKQSFELSSQSISTKTIKLLIIIDLHQLENIIIHVVNTPYFLCCTLPNVVGQLQLENGSKYTRFQFHVTY